MAWKTSFKLGIAGSELSLVGKVTALTFEENNLEVEARNVAGGKRRSILKMLVPTISMELAALPNATVARLRGLRAAQAVLNFISSTALTVTDLIATAVSATSVVMPPTSYSGVTINGVYLATDINRTGTNYFTAGSFDGISTITLGAALPGANTQVVVDFSFTGHSVMIVRLTPAPHHGQFQNLWTGQMVLEGA